MQRGVGILLLATGLCMANAPEGGAISLCTEPQVPSCVDFLDGNSSRWDFESCKDELESFRSQLREYAECLQAEIQELAEKYADAVDRYNCKLRRDGLCY